MSVLVHVLYENGQRLDNPKVLCGELKRYHNKDIQFSKPYLMLRDAETGKSLTAPLRNYNDIFMRDGGTTIVYRGTERIRRDETQFEDVRQEWEVDYCTDTTIYTTIQEHTAGADRISRQQEDDLKL